MYLYVNNPHIKITPPDMIIADLDGTLTHVHPLAAKLASVTDRFAIGLSKGVVWAYNTAVQTCDTVGLNRSIVHTVRNTVTPMITREQEDSFFMLNAAFHNGIPCVLLSNGPQKWGNYVLYRLGLRPFFDKTFFREDMPRLKPNPRSLEPVAELIPSTEGRRPVVWIFGDRASDMLLAVNASHISCDFVAVALKETKAAHAIKHHKLLQNHPGCIIFETVFAMACALRPQTETLFEKYVCERTNIPPQMIDSPRLS